MIALAMLRTFGADASDRALLRAAKARSAGDYRAAFQWQRIAEIIQYEHLMADDGAEVPSVAAKAFALPPLGAWIARAGRWVRIHLLLTGVPALRWPHVAEGLLPRALLEVLTGFKWSRGPVFQQAVEGS